jgi:hypothetical protein
MKRFLPRACASFLVSALILSAAFPNSALATALDDPASRTAATAGGGAGGLTPVVPEIDAGDVTIGATAQVVMRFRNDSGKDINISRMDLYPSSTVNASISVDECSKTPLSSGSECAVVVNVKGLKTGTWRVEALVRHDAKARITTSSMKGDVQEGSETTDKLLSDVETIPGDIDFGSITSGRAMVKSVILRNVTSDPLEITNIRTSPEDSGFSINTDCSKLLPGGACAVALTWTPTTKGTANGILLVEHTGATKVASVEIKGDYNPSELEAANIFPEAVAGRGLLVASQEQIDFGSVNNEASVTVSMVNVGDSDLTIGDIELGGVENGLSISRQGCAPGVVLKPVEACPLTLTWAAIREGNMIDDVQIHHDGARGVLVLPVRGSATAAVNRDSKAVVVESTSSPKAVETAKPINKSSALEGFVITSLSGKKAIINGPGGSRVVNKGQTITLGGIQWQVDITPQGIDFISGKDRVRLLFDASLSSINRTATQSTNTTGTSGGSTSSGSTTTSTSTPSSSTSNTTSTSTSP